MFSLPNSCLLIREMAKQISQLTMNVLGSWAVSWNLKKWSFRAGASYSLYPQLLRVSYFSVVLTRGPSLTSVLQECSDFMHCHILCCMPHYSAWQSAQAGKSSNVCCWRHPSAAKGWAFVKIICNRFLSAALASSGAWLVCPFNLIQSSHVLQSP